MVILTQKFIHQVAFSLVFYKPFYFLIKWFFFPEIIVKDFSEFENVYYNRTKSFCTVLFEFQLFLKPCSQKITKPVHSNFSSFKVLDMRNPKISKSCYFQDTLQMIVFFPELLLLNISLAGGHIVFK